MKRKLFIILLGLIAVVAGAFGITACTNKQDENEEVNQPPKTEEEDKSPHEHEYGEWVIETPADCTNAGEKRRYCECGEYEYEEIPALGHDLEHHAGKEASCTENGWKEYETCKRDGCDYTTYEEIHSYHVYEDGFCVNCGKSQSDYELNEDGTYCFTGYGDATEKDFVIPSEINGIPVTSIGEHAFADKSNITSVKIPEGVTAIGSAAFEECFNLKYVEIPNSVISIGSDAFYGCDSLEYNVRGNGNYLGNDDNPYRVLAKVDTSVEAFEIDSDTKIIYYGAFANCSNLRNIEIPETVIELGGDVFVDCTSLASVTLPNNLTIISAFAFQGCVSLSEISIPASVTTIGWGAFEGCTSLESVTIPSGVTIIGDSAFGNSGIRELIFEGSDITSIGGYAFFMCENLEYVVFPEGVITLGDYLFTGCLNLEWVYIPTSVTSIGWNMFELCEGNDIKIFYNGTQDEWNEIIFKDSASYKPENIYFYSFNRPSSAGNYWQWGVSGWPEVWVF